MLLLFFDRQMDYILNRQALDSVLRRRAVIIEWPAIAD
jgi:hypothetical protein